MSDTQRYRVNYRLLVSLVAGGAVTAGAAFGLWWFQVNRNATRLLAKAEEAEKRGEDEEAFESLNQYLKLRPKEDDARLRLGQVAVKLAEYADKDYKNKKTRGDAYLGLIDAVLRTGDQDLRRKLVDVNMKYGATDRALQNIEELLAAGKGDAKLKALKAQCLFANQRGAEAANYCMKLVGFDRTTEKFDSKAAEAADQPLLYAMLAQYFLGDGKPEIARKVIDQVIVANPKSREAYVLQYQVLRTIDKDAARVALDEAYKLDPDDAVVLLSKGVEELQDYQAKIEEAVGAEASAAREAAKQHLDAAAKFFARGREKHPDRIAFYENAARVELASERVDGAMAIIDKGLKEFDLKNKLTPGGIPIGIDLHSMKVELLLGKNDVAGAKAEIQRLRDLNNSRIDAVADFHDARIEVQNQNWIEAARQLEDVKARLISFPNMQATAGAYQGICYSALGQLDMALQAFDWALERNPGLPIAVNARKQIEAQLRPDAQQDDPQQFDAIVQKVLALPKAQQDWDMVTAKIDEYIDGQAKFRTVTEGWVGARKQLLRAQMYAARALAAENDQERNRLFDEAKTAIREANRLDPDDIAVQMAAPRLLAMIPKTGPSEALKVLDATIKRKKDAPAFRSLRIDLLAMLRDEQLPSQLWASTENMEDWTPMQQAQIWAAVAGKFEQLGKFQDALACLERAAGLAPNILQFRLALFELGRKQADDAAMRSAQEKILELVKSKTDPTYVLTEVKRRIWGYAAGTVTKEELQQARAMLDQALKQRSGWAELHLVSGQLSLILEKNTAQALRSFDKALASGPADFNALNLQVRLLAELGRYVEARARMDKAPPSAWPALFGQVGPTILTQVGEKQEAFNDAKKVVDANPNNPSMQVWFSNIAREAGKSAEAEAALKKAIELNPTDPELWSGMLTFYMNARKGEDVERTLREAQLALDEEFLPPLMAKQHELFRRWPQAETILLSYYGDKITEPYAARRLAEFYLLWGEQDPAVRDKAAVHINHILRGAGDGKLKQDDPMVAWARRQAARILAYKGNYRDSLKAERLLEAAIAGQAATAEDQGQLVEILTLRGDPASLDRAVKIMRQMQDNGGLSAQGELKLGQALFDLREWAAARSQMQDAISRHPEDPALRVALVNMMIQKKDFKAAELWIARLAAVEAAARSAPELRLRLAAARGQMDQVRTILTQMTPTSGALTEQQLSNLAVISNLAEAVGDNEYALQVMREYARRVPGNELTLARLIALYGDLDEGLTALKQVFPTNIDDTLRLAVEMLRARRAEDPARLDEEINRLVRQARHDDPDSARRMVLASEVMEIQEQYDDAITAYNELLARDDVPPLIRATTLNNLSFLLTLNKTDLDRALTMVNEAIDIVGPISDILDTRGIVYHAQGDYAKAVADLKLCVMITPTASKYFHLAAAQLAAGDKQGALDAWEQAEEQGIAPEKVSKLEWDDLKQFQKEIEAVRSSTAQL